MDGVPLWSFLYYCIRCGDLNAALQVAEMSPYVAVVPFLPPISTHVYAFRVTFDQTDVCPS